MRTRMQSTPRRELADRSTLSTFVYCYRERRLQVVLAGVSGVVGNVVDVFLKYCGSPVLSSYGSICIFMSVEIAMAVVTESS